MREFLRGRQARILAMLFLLMMGLMLFDLSGNGYGSAPSRLLAAVTAPLQKATTALSDRWASFFSRYTDAAAAHERAAALEAENDELRRQLIELDELRRQNAQYEQELAIADTTEGLTTLPAAVIARSANARFSAFEIDVGKKDGVEVGNLVITPSGVAGMVSAVYDRVARVTTVLSPELSIGVCISATGDLGEVQGDPAAAAEGMTLVKLLPGDCAAEAGSLVVTAGVGGNYPRGLLLGMLETGVRPGENGVEGSARLVPAVEVNEIVNVSVVTGFADPVEGGE